MSEEGRRIAELAVAVRKSSIQRFRSVPVGYESWRPSAGALSFTELARHLLAADEWLFAKLKNPGLPGMVARAGEEDEISRSEWEGLVSALEESGRRRAAVCAGLDESLWSSTIPDDRFGGDVTVWWLVVRGNLDHEAHHRGQLATYLRWLRDHGTDGGS